MKNQNTLQVFPIAVIALLFVQIFIPLSHAYSYYNYYNDDESRGAIAVKARTAPNIINFADASPSPEPEFDYEGTCTASAMDAAEVEAYQQKLAKFQAEQISTLSDEALLKNDPTNKAAQQIQININLNDPPTYDIRSVASLLEYEDEQREELAKEFNIDPNNGKLTMEQVKAIAARQPGGGSNLIKSLGISTAGQIPTPEYENYKVVLPNGKSVALAELMKVQPQDKKDACMLDRNFIAGKVSFQALLDSDLYVGFDESKTVVKKPQHITATQTLAVLNSYSGSMIIPSMYEKYINTVGSWSQAEMFFALAGTVSVMFSKEGVQGLIRTHGDNNQQYNRLSQLRQGSFGSTSAKNEELLERGLDLDKKIALDDINIRNLEFETSIYKLRPMSIFIFGLGWMGAARVALSASNQVMLSSLATNDKALKDNYLQIYVNNNAYLKDFRKATDFMGSGIITDWVSNFLEAGAPRKAFDVGKVYMLAREASEDTAPSSSVTSIQKAADRWNVNIDWKGRSETSLFEDVKYQPEYTSLAMYSNNLDLGTTMNSKESLGDYFRALQVLSPLVGFVVFRGTTSQYLTVPIAALIRLGTFDLAVTHLVDPVNFKKDEMCDEEKVDNYLDWFKVLTGVSILQSTGAVFMPSQGLLQFLGSAFKNKVLIRLVEKGAAAGKTESWFGKVTPAMRKELTLAETELKAVSEPFKDAQKLTLSKFNTYTRESQLSPQSVQAQQALLEWNQAVRAEQELTPKFTEVEKTYNSLKTAVKEDSGLLKKGLTGSEKALRNLYQAMVLIDPIQLGKTVVASQGMEYVSLCKDTKYKIVAYQKIAGGTSGQNMDQKLSDLKNLGKDLNLTGLIGGIGEKIEEKSLSELLNLRAFLENSYGQISPQDLYYLHLDGATSQWFGVYDKLAKNGCFRECYDSKDGYVCADATGVTYTDKTSGKSIKLSTSKDRGLLSLMMQDLARTLVPNRIISAGLDNTCSENEILQVQPTLEKGRRGGSLIISDDSCTTTQCLRQQLKQMKISATNDLTASGFGDVLAVYTTDGRISADGGRVRFIRGVAEEEGENDTIGIEVQAPSLEATEEKDLSAFKNNYISIMGNGEVKIKGNIKNSEDMDSVSAGKLLAIITERGKIEFDEAGKRLVVALYILAKNKAGDSIKSISTAVRTNKDSNGNSVPAIAITDVQEKVGAEKEGAEMREALKEVQTDANGNLGGFQVLETDNKKFTFGTDANGNPILTVLDKTTGESNDYKINGPVRKEGNEIIVPTDQGEFRFKIDMQNGQPWLTANGPNGLAELAALIAAKGMGGMIAFDPRTGLWYALNGQDINWNQDFAKRGLSLYNTPDGTRGIPADNLYTYARTGAGGGAGG
ncbi:MAG: hypothetical protein V1658_04345, partial [Candidatus Micrarchaeota archaeon]